MSFKRKTVSLTSNSPRTPGTAASPLGGVSRAPLPGRTVPPTTANVPANPTNIFKHCGVRPSTQISIPTISTGSSNLDEILGHMGLPLGSVLLLEESGNTDFASVILRSYAAQGIIQSRVTEKDMLNDSKVITLGVDDSWGSEMPGIYMEKKEKKKMQIAEDKAKVTVGNLAHESAERTNKMKIAWRYANNANVSKEGPEFFSNPFYLTLLDYKSRIRPLPSPAELEVIKCLPIKGKTGLQSMIEKLSYIIEKTLKKSPQTVIRVLVPSFLHPAVYPPDCSLSNEVIRFMYALVRLARTYSNNVAILISISLELYPRESSLMKWIEILVDGLLHIDPFPEKMDTLATEAPSDSSSNKPYQGLVNVYKLPMFSERGQMVVRKGELAFRVGRKSFEIEEWGIPIEDEVSKAPSGGNQGETDVNRSETSTSTPVDLSKLDF